MNYTQSFEEFSQGVGPTDLALYAGIGVVLFVLFKDKLSPVQKMLYEAFNQIKKSLETRPVQINPTNVVVGPAPDFPVTPAPPLVRPTVQQDTFLELVASWRKTRDLSEKYGCGQATEKLDEVFQYLSPVVCVDEEEKK
jgi:hypothetical protein